MRTFVCYLWSACFHGGVLWLAASAGTAWHVDYAVRAGRAGAPGVPGGPRLECLLDAHVELPDVVEIVSPAAAMANVPPSSPPTAAAVDERPTAQPAGSGGFRRRSLSGHLAVEPLAPALAAGTPYVDRPIAAERLPPLPAMPTSGETSDATPLIVSGETTAARFPAATPQAIESAVLAAAGAGGEGATGAQIDRLPGPLPSNPEPFYPEELRRLRIGGTVLLRVVIGSDGSVERVTLEKTSGYRQLDDSALAAVKVWRFELPRRNGVPTRFEALLPITFAIRS